MTDIKQIYTSHQSLVGTVTPSVIRTVPFSRGGVVQPATGASVYICILLTDDQDKAQALSNQFESVFTRENKDVLILTGNPFPEMPPIILEVGGVRKLLANINTSKAIGPDQIPNQALKLAEDEIAPVLQHIFQQSLDSGELPEDWKRAHIAAIYKKGDTTNPANYRPVSLTYVCSQLMWRYWIFPKLLM